MSELGTETLRAREITRQDQVQIYQELVLNPRRKLTTSFLSIADSVKDNRLLPKGWNPSIELAQQAQLGSSKLSAEALIEHVLPILPDGHGGRVRDPYYLPKNQGGMGGGGDTLTYKIPLSDLAGEPASVQATLYYQATPPFYLQDRFCTRLGTDEVPPLVQAVESLERPVENRGCLDQ